MSCCHELCVWASAVPVQVGVDALLMVSDGMMLCSILVALCCCGDLLLINAVYGACCVAFCCGVAFVYHTQCENKHEK